MKLPVEEVIKKYQRNLYASAFNVCKNQQDSEDAVQETLIQYFTESKNFESEEHIRAWLLRVVINKAKNKNRIFFRQNTVALDDYIETLTFVSEQSQEIFEEVMKLPDKYRIVIHLFYYEGYSVNEIADILRETKSNVKTKLSRGRAMLKNTLAEVWNDDK